MARADEVVDTIRVTTIISPTASLTTVVASKITGVLASTRTIKLVANSRTTTEGPRSNGVVVKGTTLNSVGTTSTREVFQGSTKGLARSVLITLPQVMVGKKK